MTKETTMKYEISISENGTLYIDLYETNYYWGDDYTNLFAINTLYSEMIKGTWFYNDTVRHYYHKGWTKMMHI